MNFNMFIPGLEEVLIKKVEQVEDRMCIQMPIRTQRCPSCQSKTGRVHDYRIQRIKHLKWFERFTDLFYKK
jgi:transposase